MIDYVKILTGAVHPKPATRLSKRARAGVYQRCISALDRRLESVLPPLSAAAKDAERETFRAATEFVEKLMTTVDPQ